MRAANLPKSFLTLAFLLPKSGGLIILFGEFTPLTNSMKDTRYATLFDDDAAVLSVAGLFVS